MQNLSAENLGFRKIARLLQKFSYSYKETHGEPEEAMQGMRPCIGISQDY